MRSELAGKSVVVCEDEGTTLIYLRKLLDNAGMRVLACVADGRESVDQVLRERPEFVVIGFKLPNLNGAEVIRRILRTYHTYRPCIILISSSGDEQERREALEAGASACLIKPFAGSALLEEMVRALEKGTCGREHVADHLDTRRQGQADLYYSASAA